MESSDQFRAISDETLRDYLAGKGSLDVYRLELSLRAAPESENAFPRERIPPCLAHCHYSYK